MMPFQAKIKPISLKIRKEGHVLKLIPWKETPRLRRSSGLVGLAFMKRTVDFQREAERVL